MITKPYNTLSDFLKEKFGCKVFKVTLNAGFTCPNRDGTKGVGGCIYCESSTLMPKEYSGDVDIKSQLAAGIEKVRKRHKAQKFIAYFQINTNTHAPAEYLEKLYRQALHPDVVGIAISTRPDCVDDSVLDLIERLKKERYVWLELGLQSANDSTLAYINRGHTAKDFEEAITKAKARGIDTCAHVIIGLPHEDRQSVFKTIKFLAELNVWGIKFHQLQVIKGTRLEELYNEGKVRLLELEEYANLMVECLEMLPKTTIIHRLSGDAPKQFIVAPKWGANKFIIMDKITEILKAKNTFQGANNH
ncbi:MAG: TIGR01212 family radical SAM protein [Deltaproteobacteria bacterium]|nr:TIGR01212 family radical SAM protein [Deltaproteobacteria bacterium]